MHEETPLASDIMVLDGSDFTAAHCTKFINLTLKKVLSAGRVAYPLRISQIHVVNAPAFAEKMITLVRPYMHEKIKNRVSNAEYWKLDFRRLWRKLYG